MIQKHTEQIQAVETIMQRILGSALLAVYLHGSAVTGKLGPQSDIDLLAIINQPMTDDQRKELMENLLQISGHHPAMLGGARCIEVMVFLSTDLLEHSFPLQAEFIYGEWLRDNFEAGEIPMPTRDPENTLIVAQARHQSISLFGESTLTILPEIPITDIRLAMSLLLPILFTGLSGDERNVLLTLARMWYTATTGEFVAKDAAAAWAIPQLSLQDALLLDHARLAYLGKIKDQWEQQFLAIQQLAKYMQERVNELL